MRAVTARGYTPRGSAPGPVLSSQPSFRLRAGHAAAGHIPLEGVQQAVRRYELMLVLKPDAPDERASAVIDRTTRYVVAEGGQIVKVAPWGRRRLAYPIDRYRDGSYHIVVFEAPAEAIAELERSLQITEDVLRYLVTRAVKPVKVRRDAATADGADEEPDADLPPSEDDDDEPTGELIDESESEAAPAAID
jgi:small subunit ribosomal protein S6